MAERGVAWTPTLTTVLGHVAPVADFVPAARELLELQHRTLPLAAPVDYGVPARAAIAAATTGARDYLGLPGLAAGAPADLVTFERDPRTDPAALAEPVAIVAAGEVLRPRPDGPGAQLGAASSVSPRTP